MLSRQVSGYLEKASWIRRMFEAGMELKAKFGEEAVCDFSLGNPDLPPPPRIGEVLRQLADKADRPFAFGYMPNGGYPWAREAVAGLVSREQGVPVAASDVLLTCGAAGGLNVFFRAVLDPGDEVVCPAPYFVEYGFYTENHGGTFRSVPSRPLTFELDLEAMEAAVGERTRVVLVNSPNNPSGVVYTAAQMQALARMLERRSARSGRPIFLVSDEPYRFLTFDGAEAPSLLALYRHAVAVSSFSKNLSLAGERIGYVALAPDMPDKERLMQGLVLTNRILGFVNAPAIGQALAAAALESQVDASVYRRRRDAMAEVLRGAGYVFTPPRGAFYFFPQVPAAFAGDDVAFVQRLLEENILAVPGRGFGYPGYFRLTFCVDEAVIRRSAGGFARAAGVR